MRIRCSIAMFSLTALAAAAPQRVERGGIAVDFSFEAAASPSAPVQAGASAIATFRISDARTGEPLSGMRPKAWLSARRSEAVAIETPCTGKIRGFVSGQISARPDADLNGYILATLNHDKTITFLNPQIASNISKLESVVVLPSNGSDWVLTPDRSRLLVTMPDASAVAVIDTVTAKLIASVSTGDLSKPGRIAVQPGGRFAWVGLDAKNQVAVIDIAARKLVTTLPVGAGLHQVVFSTDGRWSAVTNAASDSVTLFDAEALKSTAEIAVPKTPVSVAWSSAAGLFYVASLNGSALTGISPERRSAVASIPASPGVVTISFDPEGRLGFAVNQLASRLIVFDPATNLIVGSGETVPEPDQIAFTRLYAYVRGVASEKFSLFDLSPMRRSTPGSPVELKPANIQAGRLLPSSEPTEIGPAPMIAPTPEGNSVMIANAPDRMIYYYAEGMMAPMGTLQNYRRMPRGLMVLDRSLTETAPGVFSAPVTLSSGGRFDVPFLIDQPRLAHCFEVAVEGDARQKNEVRSHVSAEFLTKETSIGTGQSVLVRFRLTNTVTHDPLSGVRDTQLLVFRTAGLAQQRQPLTERGNGIYEATQKFAQPGLYHLMLGVPSLGAKFSDLPFGTVKVSQ